MTKACDNVVSVVSKVPPHSVEAERAVLGRLLLANTLWDKVANVLTEESFHNPKHQMIFESIKNFATKKQPFDALRVAQTIQSATKRKKASDKKYILNLVKNVPDASKIPGYLDIIINKARLRKIRDFFIQKNRIIELRLKRKSKEITKEETAELLILLRTQGIINEQGVNDLPTQDKPLNSSLKLKHDRKCPVCTTKFWPESITFTSFHKELCFKCSLMDFLNRTSDSAMKKTLRYLWHLVRGEEMELNYHYQQMTQVHTFIDKESNKFLLQQ